MNADAPAVIGGTAKRLIAGLTNAAQAAVVDDVRIGLGYIAVKLADDRTGVAYTFRDQAQGGCSVFHGLRPHDIQVVVGASGGDPDAIVRSFLDGRLETGANICDH
jgi:hypothetical protein